MGKRESSEIGVAVTNLKKLVPACKRCRIRSNEMLADEYLPVLCNKCVDVIKGDYPHMVPVDKPDFVKARECLWEHDRECGCWAEGLRFPEV